MNRHPSPPVRAPRACPALLAAAVVALAASGVACKASPKSADGRPGRDAAGTAGGATDGGDGRWALPSSPLGREREDRWYRIDTGITQWDAVQREGRDQDAAALAGKIADDVDGDFDALRDAAQGKHGVQAEYLGVKAMGFSRRPEATDVLVGALRSADAALVGNVLIALKLRADPNTSLPPLVSLLRTSVPEVRRYAPLALANVVTAREKAGRPVEDALADEAMTGLIGLVQDRDPYVRLHTAKAMGALRRPEGKDFLVILLRDEHVRIRLAAAAALQRIGDPRAFPDVVRLLDDVPEDQKTVLRDVLASYAERLQGRPLAAAEIAALGTSPTAWDRWYTERARPR